VILGWAQYLCQIGPKFSKDFELENSKNRSKVAFFKFHLSKNVNTHIFHINWNWWVEQGYCCAIIIKLDLRLQHWIGGSWRALRTCSTMWLTTNLLKSAELCVDQLKLRRSLRSLLSAYLPGRDLQRGHIQKEIDPKNVRSENYVKLFLDQDAKAGRGAY